VLIEQDFAEVQVQRRRTHWQPEYYYLGEIFLLDSVGLSLNVIDLYERLENMEIREFMLQQSNETAKQL
jgi:hypothetical protein